MTPTSAAHRRAKAILRSGYAAAHGVPAPAVVCSRCVCELPAPEPDGCPDDQCPHKP